MRVVRVDRKRTNFPWAIVLEEGGLYSQTRFASEADAAVAYRNYTLGRHQ